MVHVEFHCHTIFSKDSLLSIQKLLETLPVKGIDKIAITDHNTIRGALVAKKLAPEKIIIGEEIMTTEGELLAFFVQEEIPALLTPEETIHRLKKQGAFISVSHPFDRYRKGHWDEKNLARIIPYIDSIEIFNARCIHSLDNQKAQKYAREMNICGMVGSDAHTHKEIGKAMMSLPNFQNRSGLMEALKSSIYRTELSSPWIHLSSRYATLQKKIFGNKIHKQ